MKKNNTRESSRGKWRAVLAEFGFTPKELSGSHGPCPICGGKDRFRFTDYQANGDYFCQGCGPGSGFDLLMRKFDWEFSFAAKKVDESLGIVTDKHVFAPKVNEEKRRRDLNELWRAADNGQDILRSYMASRCIDWDDLRPEWLEDLRGIREMFLAYSDKLHEGMIALIRNKDGTPISIHRTFIAEKVKKIMPPTEKMTGAAVWLGRALGDTLVIGEGIETTLSGMVINDCSGYAAISANNMEELHVPKHISKVIILADHDHSFTGQKSAFTLARRMDNDGKRVEVWLPEERGYDINDMETTKQSDMFVFSNEDK